MFNKTTFRDFPAKAQEFSQYEVEYFLNKDGVLEEYPALKDCQAVIDSNYETVYQRILEQLLQPVEGMQNASADFIAQRESAASKLDILLEADEVFASYREENPDFKGATKAQIIKHLEESIRKEYDPNENENKTASQVEQKELSPDGSQSSQA